MGKARRQQNNTNDSIDSLIARIAALETKTQTVYAIYQNTAGTGINNTPVTYPFPTKIIESSPNLISGGVFTAPVAGRYFFAMNAFSVSTMPASTSWYWIARKNGASDYALDDKAGTGATNTGNTVKVSGFVDLLPGDNFRIVTLLDTATTINTLNTSGSNMFFIMRVGDI